MASWIPASDFSPVFCDVSAANARFPLGAYPLFPSTHTLFRGKNGSAARVVFSRIAASEKSHEFHKKSFDGLFLKNHTCCV